MEEANGIAFEGLTLWFVTFDVWQAGDAVPGLPSVDLKPLLEEAKRQLAEEADYRREADRMQAYAERLAGAPRYVVPAPEPSLTTSLVLAMDYIPASRSRRWSRPTRPLATAR